MNIVLTGPSGFIGSAFRRLALSRGHRIAGLLIPSEPVPPGPADPNLIWLRGTLDEAPWDRMQAFAPEICLHTAWITTPGVYLESPENERFRDASLTFLKKVHQLGANYILGLGTCIEYQISNQPLTEDRTPIAPTTTYARCKSELHFAMEAEAETAGFGFCWGRVFYPYGPGEHPSRLCSSILRKLNYGEKVLLKTPSSAKDYIYIEDLAGAILTIIEKGFRGSINLGTGIATSVREIASRLGTLLGKPELIEEADPPAADPFPLVLSDVSRLKSLGWKPAWTIEHGLGAMTSTVK